MSQTGVKISAKIDAELLAFLEKYRAKGGVKTRIEALEDAIRALRHAYLRSEYAAARDPEYLADVRVWG